jgi:hypothetical protein
MRLAAILLVLAVAVGAFLVLRSPSTDSAGIAPDVAATPGSEGARAPVELVRGERVPVANQPAAPAVPAAPAAEPQPVPSASDAAQKGGKAEEPPEQDNGIAALPTAVPEKNNAELVQKYERTTTEQRQQAIESIQQLFDSTPNLDPQVVVVLKQEIEWLQRSLDS